MQALDRKFTKTYDLSATDREFSHTTMVRHQGTVIAFAMDNQQQIYYTVLDMEQAKAIDTIDSECWNIEPQRLPFPNEIAQIGYGAAGVHRMPLVETDAFLSSTARLTANAPFQVLSDEKHVYVFRQSIANSDLRRVTVKNAQQQDVAIVHNTLLLDRFVYNNGKLNPKLEVRYQRSRKKDIPANRKDALGYEDLEKKPFYEPTQELDFIRNLENGKFSSLLVPTHLPDVQRWQIFAYNSATQRMDSFNIERSTDGLFNTKGTRYYTSPEPEYQQDVYERNPGTCPFTNKALIPLVSESGFAESALQFDGVDDCGRIPHSDRFNFATNQDFTIEVWLKAASVPTQTDMCSVLEKGTGTGAFPYAIRYINAGADARKVQVARSDGSKTSTIVSKRSINDGKFHHCAFVKQGAELVLYIDGEEAGKTNDTCTGNTQTSAPLFLASQNGQWRFFSGQMDEVRIWSRARSQEELVEEMCYRLVGNELDLVGYWRMDEGAGAVISDQTDAANHGQLFALKTVTLIKTESDIQRLNLEVQQIKQRAVEFKQQALVKPELRKELVMQSALLQEKQLQLEQLQRQQQELKLKQATAAKPLWVQSTAPVGEHPGIRRSSFSIAGRTIAAGCTALLYYQQEQAETGYNAIEKKPIKRNARVMFAVATAAQNPTQDPTNPAKNQIAVLDFAVSRAGSLAQVADTIALPLIDKSTTINPNLDQIQQLEAEILQLQTAIRDISQARVTYTPKGVIDTTIFVPRSLAMGTYEDVYPQASLEFEITVPPSLEVILDWQPVVPWSSIPARTDVIAGGTTFYPGQVMGVGAWRGVVKRLTVRQAASIPQASADLQKRLTEKQSQLASLKEGLVQVQEVKLTMPFLQVDPEGLTVMGALLGFAWTDRAPLLFESVNGRLSLYFKGQDTNEFFAAYYNVVVGRASFTVLTKTQVGTGNETKLVEGGAIRFIARTAGKVLADTTIAIAPSEPIDPKTCTVTLTNTTMGVTETWRQVPREVQAFTTVLNGMAQPTFIGALAESASKGAQELVIKGRLNYAVASKAILLVGKDSIKVTVSEVPEVEANAPTTTLSIEPMPSLPTIAIGEPVYLLPYDYATQAQVTAPIVMRSLDTGSLLVTVEPNQAVGEIQDGTAQIGEPALSAQWFADSQGSALNLDGTTNLVKTAEFFSGRDALLARFAPGSDLTLEAWVNPSEPTGNTARIITHHVIDAAKTASNYTLGLEKVGGRYKVFAAVGGKTVQTVSAIASFKQTQDEWVHLAAVFNQSYALRFNGRADWVDCGSDVTLDITGDLTIEAFICAADLSRRQGILRKGKLGDGMPYALSLNFGQLQFAFEDENSTLQTFTTTATTATLTPNRFYKVAVTRERVKPTVPDDSGDSNSPAKLPKFSTKQSYLVKFYIQGIGLISSSTYEDASPRSSSLTCAIAEKINDEGTNFQGDIAEVRVWSAARSEKDLFTRILGSEKGLVSWWRFEENEGNLAYDSKSNNHGTRFGATWIKSPDPDGSELFIYRNGEKQRTESRSPVLYQHPQFTLGSRVTGIDPNTNAYQSAEYFRGQIDEIRIWKVVRTEQQIQDNLFRPLMSDFDQLIAYYDCDRQVDSLLDQSGQQLHLKVFGAPMLSVLSTAPISNEAAPVRSALSGVKTTFHEAIASAPAVQEYGDMQTDSDGNLTAVMKRCYAYIKDRKWQLITGFKVGDLELEWIGQAQYDPQLKGFIEGAPPVPSENLTIRDANQGEVYNESSSVQLTSADSVFYTYSTSKENGIDNALRLQAGMGIQSKSDAGFGMTTEVEATNIMFGIRGNMETSNSWLSDQTVGFGKATSRLSRIDSQGAWEEGTPANQKIGKRYIPKNTGFALVESATADVFALRLKHRDPDKRITVALKMRPNPDIPRDWNIIMFPINPRYIKQGTLDGKIGLDPDRKDYPNAMEYSSDRSYFKPIEAYHLKHRIEQEQKELEADYQTFATDPAGIKGMKIGAGAGILGGGIGAMGALVGASVGSAIGGGIAFNQKSKLPSLSKMNLFNTYVWTADGGLFAETQQFSTVQQDVTAGSFSLSGMAGLFASVNTSIAKVAVGFELEALMGGHLNLTTSKTAEASSSFGVDVTLDVERDIRVRDAEQADRVGVRSLHDANGDRVKCPGKVDGYRFMTFYLEPDKEHFNDFSNKIVDRAWLEQSNDPNAAALRKAIETKSGVPWRILHRVTYISRVLPEIGTAPAGSTDETLRAANIASNWELVKRLEPYVQSKTRSYAELKVAVEQAIDRYLPELSSAKPDIVQYMSLYYQVFK
ncbi:MAG: LamG domain-containing protein [Phormidium tanganyikae FI6-MK23]|jgi:hypothetical protein|nr:LamG domain-containing protein [Phormidium tanganyikae FI6-MK23]